MNTIIYNKLMELEKEKRIPFHMPGHKRMGKEIFQNVYGMDITEITGYDNLHNPEGIIRESMNQLKEIYGTKESWYLINGSTVGILASIAACCAHGDGILISRNCHKSVYHAIQLLQLKAYYFAPEMSKEYHVLESIDKSGLIEIKNILKQHPSIKAVILPSPTYEGVVMDIAALKREIEPYGSVLIVDEAHGAHFIYHDYFPKSAIECGADIVIQSTHKTLPAMTQTALLHLCSDKVHPEKIANMLSIFESSSPSYILMASAEYAAAFMNENVDAVSEYVDNLKNFRSKCEQLKNIHLIDTRDICCNDYDKGKLVFSVKDTQWDGICLFHTLLEKYHIELEMADRYNCIAMTSVCDTKEMYDALFDALLEIDENMLQKRSISNQDKNTGKENIVPKKILESWECNNVDKEKIALEKAEGKIAGAFVMLYPPGIPVLVPGEKIEKETVENLRYYIYNGYNVIGLSEGQIIVLKNRNEKD